LEQLYNFLEIYSLYVKFHLIYLSSSRWNIFILLC